MKKISIVIPVWNGLEYTRKCLKSIYNFTNVPFEVIVIDNGSRDGTHEYLFEFQKTHRDNFIILTNETNQGFARANNQGVEKASGDYFVFLNNDTIVTKNWLKHMVRLYESMPNIGIVGPVSNYAGGNQGISASYQDEFGIQNFAHELYQQNIGQYIDSYAIVGLCFLISRKIFEKIGKWDEMFLQWDDNDYSLRVQLAGLRLLVDRSTFIHHFGSATLKREGLLEETFWKSRLKFIEKWKAINSSIPQKLVGMLRIKNAQEYIVEVLEQAHRYCDEIVIFDDNSMDGTFEICQNFQSRLGKIKTLRQKKELGSAYETWDEGRDRNTLLQWAKEREPTWVMSIDADEVVEDSFIRGVRERLMIPEDPKKFLWAFPVIHFWNNPSTYRTDGLWGDFMQGRLFRNLPNQFIFSTKDSHHCGSHPNFLPENIASSYYRIKHYGNLDPIERQRKYKWYTETDKHKDISLILGRWVNYYKAVYGKGELDDADLYRHIVDERGLKLRQWQDDISLSICMLYKDGEQASAITSLNSIKGLNSEIILADTGRGIEGEHLEKEFGAKRFQYQWKDDFADARNFVKRHASGKWIFRLDPDEALSLEHQKTLWNLLQDDEADAFLFPIINFLEDPNKKKKPEWVLSETIRLYKNYPELYYTRCVHEDLHESIDKFAEKLGRKFIIKKAPFELFHYGYLRPEDDQNRRFGYYAQLLEKWLNDHPQDAKALFSIAVHYFHINQWDKAVYYYEKTLENDPNSYMALNDLGVIYFSLGEQRKAIDYFTKAQNYLPESASFYYRQKINNNLQRTKRNLQNMMLGI